MAIAIAGMGRDARVIGLVSVCHFLSHFFIFVLPPLFPLLKDEFGVSYAALGLLPAAFNIASGLTQAPVGFLVDRFGARRLLIGGLVLESLAFLAMGAIGLYPAMLGLMVIAGLANSVYHPADYAILSAAVDERRIGRAFSIHTFPGFLGNAVTPALAIYLALAFGWQGALLLAGVLGLGAAALLLTGGEAPAERPPPPQAAGGRGGLAVVFSLPVVMCFVFYIALSMSSSGLNSFAAAAFVQIYDIPLADAGWLLTVFLGCNALGILAGGVLADRVRRHELVAMAGLGAAAVLVATVGLVSYGYVPLLAVLAAAGLMFGLMVPSRDMLVRAVAPPGSVGKVFGFVSTGCEGEDG